MTEYQSKFKKNKERADYTKLLLGESEEFVAQYLTDFLETIFKAGLNDDVISVFGTSGILTQEQMDAFINSLHSTLQEVNVNVFFYPTRRSAIKSLFGINVTHKKHILKSIFSKKQDLMLGQWGDGIQLGFAEYNIRKDGKEAAAMLCTLYCIAYLVKELPHLKNDQDRTIERLQRKAFVFGLKSLRRNKENLHLEELVHNSKKLLVKKSD